MHDNKPSFSYQNVYHLEKHMYENKVYLGLHQTPVSVVCQGKCLAFPEFSFIQRVRQVLSCGVELRNLRGHACNCQLVACLSENIISY